MSSSAVDLLRAPALYPKTAEGRGSSPSYPRLRLVNRKMVSAVWRWDAWRSLDVRSGSRKAGGMRSRRVLVVCFAILVGSLWVTATAAAARRATTAELMKMSSFSPPASPNGFFIEGLVSTHNSRFGLVLLTPKPPGVTGVRSNPLAAYLFRKPTSRTAREWTFLAQTLLRGNDVSASELQRFCAMTGRRAPDLTPRACRR